MIGKKKVFLASSAELVEDRRAFADLIRRKNDDWIDKGVYIQLIVWEDSFLDALAPGGLQQKYNEAIRDCDLFVMLFWTRVGEYTEAEFDAALGQFQATRKPFVFTYYKDAELDPGMSPDPSLAAFQARLRALQHYQTCYKNTEGLLYHFSGQLDRLAAAGFIAFEPNPADWPPPAAPQHSATLHGSGAIAQNNSTAVGAGGVLINGKNNGFVNTGTVHGESVVNQYGLSIDDVKQLLSGFTDKLVQVKSDDAPLRVEIGHRLSNLLELLARHSTSMTNWEALQLEHWLTGWYLPLPGDKDFSGESTAYLLQRLRKLHPDWTFLADGITHLNSLKTLIDARTGERTADTPQKLDYGALAADSIVLAQTLRELAQQA
jgi:hypothetical protein